MADSAVVSTPVAKKVVAKKTSGPKKPAVPAAHPTYSVMIGAAVKALKERSGSSRQAILKYIMANYKVTDEKKAGVQLRMALRKAVVSGALKQAKGNGASGSFRLGEGKDEKPKKVAAKKAAAKKPKVAKVAKPKAAKKSPKKAAKKPAAAKVAKPKTVKAAKPVVEKAAKPTAEKKSSKPKPAKKPAAKKVAKKPAVKKAAPKK